MMDTLDEPEPTVKRVRTSHIVSTMTCVLCGREKAFPDGFPSVLYAECWRCCWERHDWTEHKPKWNERRKMKKRIRKEVKIRFTKELRESRNP